MRWPSGGLVSISGLIFENGINYEIIWPVDTTELLLHPVRLRIVHATFDGQLFTTSDLRERMPDVSKATMYRQVALLVDNGLMEIDGEERKRGAVERRYRLQPARTIIDADAAAAMTKDDHRRGFGASLATLLAEFGSYLDQETADPTADMVSYRQAPLWLSDDEKRALYEALLEAIRPHLSNPPRPNRRRHLLAAIMFPTHGNRDSPS
jgi:DNA-binding transcriptional ArsR family regulator